MKSNHLLLVLFIMLVYGSSYPVGKLGVDNIPPLLFSALRVGLIFLVFLPFFKFKLPRKEMIKPLVLFSLTMGVGTYVSMYFALERLTIVAPIIIGAQLSIPFGILLSYFFLKDNISINRIILIIISFLGIIIIAYDPRIIDDKIAVILIVTMAFFYALSNMLARVMNEVDTSVMNGWHGLISFVPIILLSFYFEGNPIQLLEGINNVTIFSILHCALIVSSLGHVSMFYLYKFYPVSKVLPFYSLFPIFGIVLTIIMFNELLSMYEIIGGILVMGSAYLIHKENNKEDANIQKKAVN